MLWAEFLLVDGQRSFVQWQRARKIALGVKQGREVAEGHRSVRVLWAERLLGNLQCALVEWLRACKVATKDSEICKGKLSRRIEHAG
jgi:hypothetical protein